MFRPQGRGDRPGTRLGVRQGVVHDRQLDLKGRLVGHGWLATRHVVHEPVLAMLLVANLPMSNRLARDMLVHRNRRLRPAFSQTRGRRHAARVIEWFQPLNRD